MIVESFAHIDEKAHVNGIALIPRISRNDNLYTKKELERFDNVTVPLNWEHDREKIIGTVTFHYDPNLETVYYDGDISDPEKAELAKNKTLFASIEAQPTVNQKICNGPNDCFSMPFGLKPEGLALTESPGVPETSVKIIESYFNKVKEASLDEVIQKLLADLEARIIAKYEILQALEQYVLLEPQNEYYLDQVAMCKNDLVWLVNQHAELKSKVPVKSEMVEKLLGNVNLQDIPELGKIIRVPKCEKCGKRK